ncbi:hypothetical protein [Rhizobium lusitanum]|uniref:hypothetical protein n=1 Tax=Rhizobium lusitanum TaxID=293958 RepID=UPI001FD088BC|nr:hypothetical protein [Rhizobium lusitanum]
MITGQHETVLRSQICRQPRKRRDGGFHILSPIQATNIKDETLLRWPGKLSISMVDRIPEIFRYSCEHIDGMRIFRDFDALAARIFGNAEIEIEL